MRKGIQEFILATILTILIFYTGISIIPFLLILFPLNFIILGIRTGLAYSLGSFIISMLAVYILGSIESVVLMSIISLVALPIILGVKKGLSPIRTIFLAAGLVSAINIILLAGAAYQYEGSFLDDLELRVQESTEESFELIEESTELMDLNLDINRFKASTKELISLVITALPGILVVYSLIISLINYYASSLVLRKDPGRYKMGKFRFFRLPANFSLGILYSFLALLVLGLLGYSYQDELVLNLGIVMLSLYMVQGSSVIVDIAGEKSMVLALIINLFLLSTNLSILLAFLGMLEGVFNLRLMWRKRNE